MSLRTDRRPGDIIRIGSAIITIDRVTTGKVSLSIWAPESTEIDIPKAQPDICRCGAESFGDAGGLCWPCFKRDQED